MYRIGQSRDVHRLEKGLKLTLGTVEIPYEYGLVAHSDGDCLVHAIVESIIGALGLGDIGTLFPDSDSKYKNISSKYFLNEVKMLLKKHQYEIVNIDSSIHIEKPMMRPYVSIMKENIASCLGIDKNLVNIKATRGEKIGFVGRCEGIEAD